MSIFVSRSQEPLVQIDMVDLLEKDLIRAKVEAFSLESFADFSTFEPVDSLEDKEIEKLFPEIESSQDFWISLLDRIFQLVYRILIHPFKEKEELIYIDINAKQGASKAFSFEDLADFCCSE